MNKLITLRTMISGMLVFLFSLPLHAQELSGIEGTIIDENGELMTGVKVEVFSEGIKRGTATTGADGMYFIKPIPTGIYEIKATYPEYEEVFLDDVFIGSTSISTMDMNFTPLVYSDFTPCGSRVKPLLLTEPAKHVSITGRLKDAFNMPAAGVRVEIFKNDTLYWCSTYTNEKGCYRIYDVDTGKFTIQTTLNGVKMVERHFEIQEVEYVDEIVINLYHNKKILNHKGIWVDSDPTVTALDRNYIMRSPVRR